jgi:hypothetical protein
MDIRPESSVVAIRDDASSKPRASRPTGSADC